MFWRQWNCELIKRYRLNREGIKLVVELVWDAITSLTNRNNPISPEIKCLATLRYLATGKMQLCNADDLGISQHQSAVPYTKPSTRSVGHISIQFNLY